MTESILAPHHHDADELLLGFARALRAAGVPVTQDRSQAYLEATSLVGLDDQRATYWAGRATLCSGPDDLDRYDQVFEAWFLTSDRPMGRAPKDERQVQQAALETGESGGAGDELDEDTLHAMASEAEVLRQRDIAEMPASEKARLAAMFETLQPRAPHRSAQRRTPWHRGDVDAQRTLRLMLRRMGEPGEIAYRRRSTRPRRVVLLVDVSGSMSAYADALLRLAHRFSHPRPTRGAPPRTEVFTLGTRLTRVTRAMRMRDAERAIIAAGETVPDWSGGTRLGETLRIFMDRWGQRGLARGAVVVVFSDGWERGDASLLGEQMSRLHRIAHRVVWVNPHVGKDGYLPVQQGIVAALPYVDDLVAGHSLATFEDLIEVVAHA
ncbi:vWA domain-containing protein [Nocardioides panacis]|uniref:vWA domain-containing protein n=1 Tax=Nocardioides panacis TaxID=2849501 RepID=UPI0020B401FD|nr:VWA domain-containing protein [Nocardioides panacis]